MIQGARIAFGYGGIYDDDEAARIVESTKQIDPSTGEITQPKPRQALPDCPDAKFKTMLPKWRENIESGGVVSDLMAMLQSKYTLTQEQIKAINDLAVVDAQPKEPATALADDPFVQAME
jgi:hypothetical protein